MNEHICSDLYTAAALVADGQRPLRVTMLGQARAAWVFDDADKKASLAVSSYWSGSLRVRAKAMVSAIYELRRQLDAAKARGGQDSGGEPSGGPGRDAGQG